MALFNTSYLLCSKHSVIQAINCVPGGLNLLEKNGGFFIRHSKGSSRTVELSEGKMHFRMEHVYFHYQLPI